MNRRLPAEWERQDAVLIAWPHENTDWAPRLDAVEPVFAEIAAQISFRERVIIVTTGNHRRVTARLKSSKARMSRIHLFDVETDDTWARDFGPITVLDDGRPVILKFVFNGWGLKFPAGKDNRITKTLHEQGAFGATRLKQMRFVLEGGSIESDGKGTLLTTCRCLLSPRRNPGLPKPQITRRLKEWFGLKRVLWLDHGLLLGDDTDSHIDTLARFCPGDTITFVTCDNKRDVHYEELRAMRGELERLRTSNGMPYRLLPLPLPAPRFDENERRLPATYANFLVLNGAVLVPQYNDKHDKRALRVLTKAFPARQIIGIPCLPLIFEHGSLHCVTMQIPEGVLP